MVDRGRRDARLGRVRRAYSRPAGVAAVLQKRLTNMVRTREQRNKPNGNLSIMRYVYRSAS